MLDDQIILELAQGIGVNNIYESIFKLLNIKWKTDINLSIKKMEIVFQRDEKNATHLECLTEAHNQMLFLI